MIDMAVVEALYGAGVTIDQLMAGLRAMVAVDEARKARTKDAAAARQRAKRERDGQRDLFPAAPAIEVTPSHAEAYPPAGDETVCAAPTIEATETIVTPSHAESRVTDPERERKERKEKEPKRKERKEREDDDEDRAREPQSLITLEAFTLADRLLELQRIHPDDPRAIGAAYQAQCWITKGWNPQIVVIAVKLTMARRTEAPGSLRYFEPEIARQHAEQQRALPIAVAGQPNVVNIENMRNRNGKTPLTYGLAALSQWCDQFTGGERYEPQIGQTYEMDRRAG
jgi:hypothetical protein